MIEEQLLTVIFSDEIKDDIVDSLIAMEALSGFSLSRIDGYSRQHSQYDVKEQVAGYRQMWRAEVVHRVEQQVALLRSLEETARASHLRYWVTPLSASGTLGAAQEVP
ncbi:DUF3240 family protein [Pseudohalioglobus lutimaris]|uniref:DUF3240 domain-containing protein n=1 Tax=Pseudohalioglobus lutimaris TaxID=1737061 RepID=A0A2N5WYA0_9GAMM|nr:DUF3240 family protein [Pseudohalioglobus lutimaris]PLW67207.1 DUF3240 domain-containing protein [Pseudohalioglobus lutimaris]